MNWQQKLKALRNIASYITGDTIEIDPYMRRPGVWTVSSRLISLRRDNGVIAAVSGSGSDPSEAVEDYWNRLVRGTVIVHDAADGVAVRGGRTYAWDGKRWMPA